MKTKLKISLIALLAVLTFGFTSCSEDPADSDFFVGKYKGSVSYVDKDKSIANKNGSVTVIKVGSTYNFDFSDKIPSITGVKFEKKDDNTYVSIGSGLTGITISADNLNMLVVKDGATWTADCSR